MKITKYIEVSSEVEIDISAEDIAQNIFCVESNATMTEILHALNNCAAVLRGMPDNRISELSGRQKEVIHNFLMEQAKRYEP